jgi:hypothetical protein
MSFILSTQIWASILVPGSLAAMPAAVRCFTLLIGLLAVLPKSAEGDRAVIFREFARAVAANPVNADSSDSGSNNQSPRISKSIAR